MVVLVARVRVALSAISGAVRLPARGPRLFLEREAICQLSTLGRLPHLVLKSEYPFAFRPWLSKYQSLALPLVANRSGTALLLVSGELPNELLSASSRRPCWRRRVRTIRLI